jgi:xylulokinase
MRDSLEIIKSMQIPVKEIRLSGGGAKSKFWRQLQADIYGQKVVTINAEEGPAFGVALLAATGTGAYKNVEEACKKTIKVVESVATNNGNKKAYDKFYPMYGKLYQSLKADYAEIAKLVGG